LQTNELCDKIKQRLSSHRHAHVVLWVQAPGKSNFWFTVRCWPRLREQVHEVRAPGFGDPYGGGEHWECIHLHLDDALISGEQMSRYLVEEGLRFQPSYASNGTDQHSILVGAVAASVDAMARIERCIRKLDVHHYGEESDEEDMECNFPVEVIRAIPLYLQKVEDVERHLYYTSYKVPDYVSIPLQLLFTKGYLPGVKAIDGRDVIEPPPNYAHWDTTWQKKVLDWESFAGAELCV
jgi:hypothetical protein